MIVMLTAVFAQTFSSSPDIRAAGDPSIGSTFTIALGQSKISGLVHRAEIVDFGLEVSGTTKTGWFAYRHDHTGKIAVAHNKSEVTRFLQTRSGPQVFIDDISDLPGCGGGITGTTEISTLGGICYSVNAIDPFMPITEAVALAGGDQIWSRGCSSRHPDQQRYVYFGFEHHFESNEIFPVPWKILQYAPRREVRAVCPTLPTVCSMRSNGIDDIVTNPKSDLVALVSGNDYAFCGVASWPATGFGLVADTSSAAWPATPLSTNLATTWDVAMPCDGGAVTGLEARLSPPPVLINEFLVTYPSSYDGFRDRISGNLTDEEFVEIINIEDNAVTQSLDYPITDLKTRCTHLEMVKAMACSNFWCGEPCDLLIEGSLVETSSDSLDLI